MSKKSSDSNVIYVGRKPPMNYVLESSQNRHRNRRDAAKGRGKQLEDDFNHRYHLEKKLSNKH